MNRIESGTTGERWTRCLILVGLCTVFAAWFGYDGWVGYPAKNLQWALQQLPPRPAGSPPLKASTDPSVTGKKVLAILEQLKKPEASLSRSQLTGLLGNPAYENREANELFFIGPAVFVGVKLEGDAVRRPADIQVKESPGHRESDINNQKRWSIILAIVVVIALVQFVRISTMRVALDDDGLNYSGRLIRWEAMSGLDAERYHEKGWVELEYKDGDETDTLRIDNYKVKAFKEIVTAICDRKSFPNPLIEPEEPEDSQAAPPQEPPQDSPGLH